MTPQHLSEYADEVYAATRGLMKLVPKDKLDWKPAATNNWMTLGQLLEHLTSSTGLCVQCFITGEWPDFSASNDGGDEQDPMLPSADRMPAVKSVAEALEKLEKDQETNQRCLKELSQQDFDTRQVFVPWAQQQSPLWKQLLFMVEHQVSHKNLLFFYLKTLGLPVGTGHLYGMASDEP